MTMTLEAGENDFELNDDELESSGQIDPMTEYLEFDEQPQDRQ